MAGSLRGTRGDKGQDVEEEAKTYDGFGRQGFEEGDDKSDTTNCGEFIGASGGELGSVGEEGQGVDSEMG